MSAHKQPAYRGFRPAILDPIVVVHQIAVAWRAADPDMQLRYRCVAEDCLKTFVSLAQKEVGRSRAASAYASRSGNGAHPSPDGPNRWMRAGSRSSLRDAS